MRELPIKLLIPLFVLFFSCSNEREEPIDEIQPTVSLSIAGLSSSPTSEAVVVGGQIVVNVDAKDEGGIDKIEAFIDNEKVGEDISPPYSITIDLSSYASKAAKTKTYAEHVLKVTATDKSGNTSSAQQSIQVDNEMPVISDVSLEENTVLYGDTNTVTFSVTDNEELQSVIVYLNDLSFIEITDGNYELNIDTTNLQEGENTMKIEAKDNAGNVGVYIVKFFVDNSGPEITMESLLDGQEIEEIVTFNPIVQDVHSIVDSVKILFNDAIIFETENTSDINFDFNPENFPAGEAIIKIIASDSLGNLSEKVWNIKIRRLLIKLNIPEGYLSESTFTNHFVFASEMDGSFIDIAEIIFETREVKLYANGEHGMDKDFVITFASLGQGGVASYLYSIAHVNRQNMRELSLIVPKRYINNGGVFYPVNGFSESTQLFLFGNDYHFTSNEAGDKLISSFTPSNHSTETGPIYMYGFNPINNFYNYQFIDRPIASDFEINFSDFSTENVIQNQLTTTPADFMTNARRLALYGFRNQEDMDNEQYHKIWDYGYGENAALLFNYNLNTEFFAYSHELKIGNYFSKGFGLPQDNTVIPDWSIDYVFSNNTLTATKSGNGHIIGEIFMEGGYNEGTPYQWNLFFDSNKGDEIVLPNIDEALQNYPFYQTYHSNALEIVNVGLGKYDSSSNYEEYLNQIIKENKAFIKSSPRYESVYAGEIIPNFSTKEYFYVK